MAAQDLSARLPRRRLTRAARPHPALHRQEFEGGNGSNRRIDNAFPKWPLLAQGSRSAFDRFLAQTACSWDRPRRGAQGRHDPFAEPPVNGRYLRAPCQGGAFQWVQVPPGERSSRKQPEQSWR
jgi:hypothetical protein